MHGHAAFYGAYAMIVMAMITFALPSMTPSVAGAARHRLRSFWLQSPACSA